MLCVAYSNAIHIKAKIKRIKERRKLICYLENKKMSTKKEVLI